MCNFIRLQCFHSSPPAARTLRHFVGRSSDMTVESCLDQCLDGGFTLGGLEAGDECCIINCFWLETIEYLTWPLDCGNALLYQTLSEDVLPCETPCAGNSSEICGGSQLLSVYQNGDIPFTTGPAQQIFHYNDWSWNGCMEWGLWILFHIFSCIENASETHHGSARFLPYWIFLPIKCLSNYA